MLARRLVVLALLLAGYAAACVPRASAQSVPPRRGALLSPQARVSLLTVLPGEAIHAKFGHNAIRITDPARGLDRTYDYGVFTFDSPLFVVTFLYGKLDYLLATRPFAASLRHFRYHRRPVLEQRLALAPADRDALFRFLEINALPQNRTYRYDFLFDNCSTRARDAFEAVLGDRLAWGARPDPQQRFRHLLDPYVADARALDVGFDLLLGVPTDRVATQREAMFLPELLFAAFADATVRPPDGGAPRPLVTQADTLFWVPGYEAHERAFAWPLWLAWSGLALGLALAGQGAWTGRPPRAWPDALGLAAAGLAGALMAFLWFGALHRVTNWNLNLAWAWPTHLVAAGVLARAGTAQRRAWLRRYLQAASLAAGVVAAGWALWPQDLHPAVVPLVLLLAVRCARHGWPPPAPTTAAASDAAAPARREDARTVAQASSSA